MRNDETPAANRGSEVIAATTTSIAPNNGGRCRRTKAAMESFREALYELVAENRPCSVRQIYYIGIGTLWEKDQGKDRTNYNDVVRNLGVMRENGQLPWGWLTDSTRYVRVARMYDSLDDAFIELQRHYRRNIWSTQNRRVEVWAESDSTSSLIDQVTMNLGVGLYSCRGQAGKEFAYSAAETYLRVGKPVTVLYVGDWDPSGLAISRSLEERLRKYSEDQIDIDFQRLAVTPEQIEMYGLQTHSVNTSDSSFRRFAEECRLVGLAEQHAVEAEAFPPQVLRDLVYEALMDLVDDAETWNLELDDEVDDQRRLTQMIEGSY